MSFVSFITVDNVTLEGDLVEGNPNRAVILSHMHGGSYADWEPFSLFLAEQGYTVLAYDNRRHGDVQEDHDVAQAPADLRAAVRFLADWGAADLFLVGASMGGTASLIVAAEGDPTVRAAVAIGAPAVYLGMDAVVAAPQITVPVLFVVSEGDSEGPDEAARASSLMTADNETMVLAGNLHGTDLFYGPDAAAVQARIFGFIDAN